MIVISLIAALGVAPSPAPAPAPTPEVQVSLGPAVQARASQLGPDELDQEREQLRQAVVRALARSHAPVSSVRLVIQDIQPNRPTPAELAASPGYSPSSFGVGGAAVTGEVVAADGSVRPLRYRFFQQDLRNVLSLYTWSGAQEAFSTLADRIGSGAPPDDQAPWPRPYAPEAPTGSRIRPG